MIEQTLEALSFNSDDYRHSSSTINSCRCIAENYEEEFITAACDSSLEFSSQMSADEWCWSYFFSVAYSSKIMKSLGGDMIIPKFGEYNYYHEAGTKPELILS